MPRLKRCRFAFAFVLAACSSDVPPSGAPSETPDDPSSDEACAAGSTRRYPSQVEYRAGLELTGTNGISVTLVGASPAPPARNENEWDLLVELNGEPVEGARIVVLPWMPKHGHGSTTDTVVTDEGEGRYTVFPIYLRMGGFFDIKVTVEAGSASDSVNFGFCVD